MSNEKVIPTAWLTAYSRTFSDIPFAKDIFSEFEKVRQLKGEVMPEELKMTATAPQVEARYKLTNRSLEECKINQILEIAAGLSPRSLKMTNDQSIRYVEFDLPNISKEKLAIVKNILGELPENLSFTEGSALEFFDLQKATEHFERGKPIAVINEGLMRYFSFKDKETYAKNVYDLLSLFGGVWITPDISMVRPQGSEMLGLKSVGKIIGVDLRNNLFKDEMEAKRFFEDLGFEVARYSFLEVIDQLVSPKTLNLSEDKVKDLIGHNVLFVMKIKEGKSLAVENGSDFKS